MKICIVSFEYMPVENGITISVDRIARTLSKSGIEAHIVCFSHGKSNGIFFNGTTGLDTENSENLYVHRISPFSGNVQYPSPQELQEMIHYICQLDKRYGFDIIHGFRLVPAGFAAVMAAGKIGKPCVVSIRGNDVARNCLDLNLFSMSRFVLENAGKLTFVSQDLLELADQIASVKKKSAVIHNSFDPSLYMYLTKQPKINANGRVIGTAGIIRQKKGFAYLLEAFSKYRNSESTLMLIGDFIPEEADDYLKMIKNYELSSSFIKTGVIKHKYILNYLSRLDVFVLPSLTEGCSNAMLEAMYLKIPVIATDVGAARDMKQAVLVEPRDSGQICDALARLEDKGFRDDLTDKAYTYLQKNLNPETEAKKWRAVYAGI